MYITRNPGKSVIAAILLLILIQLVPYGRNHTNPPATGEPAWNTPETRNLFMRACGNCHSNETKWPWYSRIAPASWLVQSDVDEAREKFNTSEWGRKEKNRGTSAAEELKDGDMPPFYYLPAHPEAKLTDSDKDQLLKGLIATFGSEKK